MYLWCVKKNPKFLEYDFETNIPWNEEDLWSVASHSINNTKMEVWTGFQDVHETAE